MEELQRQQEQLVKLQEAQKAKCREMNAKLQKAKMEVATLFELERAEAKNSFDGSPSESASVDVVGIGR